MKRLLGTSLLFSLFLLFAVGCNQEDSLTLGDLDREQGDGDQTGELDDDSDASNGDGDDVGSDEESARFTPPVLLDPGSLALYFGEEKQSQIINFGELTNGDLTPSRRFAAFTFDALPGATLAVSLETENGAFQGAFAVYGPRQKNGLWGEAVSVSKAPSATDQAVLPTFRVAQYGQYLILVGSMRYGETGAFLLGLGCRDLCLEPFCPDLECMDYCAGGFLPDPDGCTTCQCGACECSEETPCPQGYACDGCSCYPSELDGDGQCLCENETFDPVCDEDGTMYPNACWAECLGLESSAYYVCGEEDGDAVTSCYYDSDCPGDMVCVNGRCQGSWNDCACPDDYDPVCGMDGQTYLNACELACNQVERDYDGVCEDVGSSCQPECREAYGEYAWVDSCSEQIVMMSETPCENCLAQCREAGTVQEGWYDSCSGLLIQYDNCDTSHDEGCGCDDVYDPVCGYAADGQAMTFANECEMLCRGGALAYRGECREDRIGCQSNQDCPSGTVCMEDCSYAENDTQTCPYVCTQVDLPVSCQSDEDCAQYETCLEGLCQRAKPTDLPCVVTGCQGEICAEERLSSSCSTWKPEYLCLDRTVCARNEIGNCAWLITQDYAACRNGASGNAADTLCSSDADCSPDEFCLQRQCLERDCVCPEEQAPMCTPDNEIYDNLCLGLCDGADYASMTECP